MAKLDQQLTALATMSPAQLHAEWERLHKTPCPPFPREVLQLAIAYRLQAKVFGDLPAATLRRLRDGASASSTPRLKPGTRLLRSWNGRTIAVTVAEDGYRFEDRSYRSLSAVAREVTGTAWSGPRFFGLREVSRG